MTTIKKSLAGPSPVGLCGFVLITWPFGLINDGFFTAREGVGLILSMALTFDGTA